ncbi:RelA/SpoT family protein [Desulfoplanes formicivorans]|uniref:GTP pyrophosphokinase n=1 Tax=Desulfoplanes formicivorans TaxID=1592317 RepID=A0A194AIU4_9BACT|nr:bifunctional (p)ppGpp synthetase/guanosine-3',5'-bis(diphosphate) 3'-pyrophosphohydrolase [Desulfoplanes formicivorans]GAU08991.1 GTP pyrophosphokinase [Desulfoplanes formicivorans]
MIRINEILDKVGLYLSPSEQGLIQKAYIFSASAHAGQIRLSGEPYLSHPLEVANILAGLQLDAPTISAGLLHDTIEDTVATREDLVEQFGEDVAKIVEGVTKISKMKFDSREEAQAENIRKMILAMADDIRVIMVKLADRLHNMRTLEFQKDIKQRLIAQETMDIYAPLANRLGLYILKIQLEDLSLRYQKPDIYNQIQEGLKQHQVAGQGYIDNVCTLIGKLLADNNVEGSVSGRIKHAYSIYHKMKTQKLTFDQIYDLIAFRAKVKTVKDCYTVLGLVHSLWKPVPGRFKDYISMPKANMYQSLHTTVIGPEGERIEIQIRTEEMHKLAEYGVAAHWIYKEGSRIKEKDADRFSWLRQILDWQGELKNPREFMSSLRFDLFQDEVYVFTPQGQVRELPEGATPVDFAYTIHTEVGNQCSGAKVNGRLVPLNTPLVNGDTVEIITTQGRHPSSDWLQFVKTAKARTRIKHWMRTEERARSISLAKEVLEKEGRKLGINFVKALKNGDLEPIAREMSLKTVDDLLSAVGYARITPKQLLHQLLPKEEMLPEKEAEKARELEAVRSREEKRLASDSIRVRGVEDVLVRFAQCCNPVPGDPIVGYISRGRGVTIHTQDCPNVANMEDERLLDVSWENSGHQRLPVKIKMKCKNQRGVLATVATRLSEEDVNIESGNFRSDIDGNTEILMTVQVRDTTHLYDTIDKLRKLPPVLEVIRRTTD